MNLAAVAQAVREGKTVSFTASGNSMTPRIRNGQMVSVSPIMSAPKVGDVVLAKVRGRYWLHKISAEKNGRFQISNNKGHINGWASEIVGETDL